MTSLGMLVSDKPISGFRKGGKLITRNSFSDELNKLLKRIPGEPKYGVFKERGGIANEDSEDESEPETEESDESLPLDVWYDDVAKESDGDVAEESDGGSEDISVEESAGEEKEEDVPRRRRAWLEGRTTGRPWVQEGQNEDESRDASAAEDETAAEEESAAEDESSPEEEDNDGSDYEASEEDASASQEDVSDYEGMPADVQDREVYQFSPEDQRRMRFRR